jgi:hypothetical protein
VTGSETAPTLCTSGATGEVSSLREPTGLDLIDRMVEEIETNESSRSIVDTPGDRWP